MDTAAVLLEEVLARPADDFPRQVYADWLQDHGGPAEQARAEFIRLQLELAELPADHERRPELEAQERRLRKRHERQWLGPLREQVHGWLFSRGFIVHLDLEAGRLLQMHDTIAHREPVTGIRLTAAREPGVLDRLADLGFLERLSILDLSNNYLEGSDVRRLLSSAHLCRLEVLRINDNPYGYDSVRAVAESTELGGLRVLELRRNNLTDLPAVMLADSPYLAGLLTLDLRGNAIGEHGRGSLQSLFGAVVRF